MTIKIGSLFDGSGGFPLAASMCGITPAWASEVEPYPIAVTRSRFPAMEHLGDISRVNGATVEPTDVITFGSPCQDLSIAGKRSGLKHTANGDDETTRSGLFMEAVRIIKEMRSATNGEYPKFALWENVPGAFSSNGGEDFRVVLEELIKIVEPEAFMPAVPAHGWAYADCYVGDGWSLAYRVFDAQHWGVPQRRRRIHLVLDLGGQSAGEILFKREGLRRNSAPSRTQGQADAGNAESGPGGANAYTLKIRSGCAGGGKGALIQQDLSATLATNNDQYLFWSVGIEHHPMDSRIRVDTSGKVRRLTPIECARLQGFPDDWGHLDKKESLSDEECGFWAAVRNAHADINGKALKTYTAAQMLAWYNKLHTDSAEYKMWGNGIALPPALYVMQGIKEALECDSEQSQASLYR